MEIQFIQNFKFKIHIPYCVFCRCYIRRPTAIRYTVHPINGSTFIIFIYWLHPRSANQIALLNADPIKSWIKVKLVRQRNFYKFVEPHICWTLCLLNSVFVEQFIRMLFSVCWTVYPLNSINFKQYFSIL